MMQGDAGGLGRRTLLTGLAATGAAAPLKAWSQEPGWRAYTLTSAVDVSALKLPVTLYIPLFQTLPSYQRARRPVIRTNGAAEVVRDRRYGASILRVRWSGPDQRRSVLVRQEVFTRDRILEPAALTVAEKDLWISGAASLPVDGIVRETAVRIVGSRSRPREAARAIYDWVVDNAFRDEAVRGCGVGGVEAMLRTGYLGGKCADINSLMVALCRAAGLPARDVYGVRLGPSDFVRCLGAGPDVTHAQHCRGEVWLDGEGWLPVDPADVAKAVNCVKAPLTSPMIQAQRERLFGSWEMNWAAYNSATDIKLPGAPSEPTEHFLMYPMALTSIGESDQLDPDTFRYKLTASAAA